MNKASSNSKSLIAPCGMNCGVCIGYLREKNKCIGCNFDEGYKAKSCRNCKIKNCKYILNSHSGYCYDCYKYPCTRLVQLDKRYRTKYRMSMIENLNIIKNYGIEVLLKQENKKWCCDICGAFTSAHREYCLICGVKIKVK